MPTGAGELDKRVDLIKKQDAVLTSDGGTSVVYQIIESRWAKLQPIGMRQGHRNLSTRNLAETNTHDIIIRHEDQFENRGLIDHAVIKGKMYEVQNVVTENEDDLFLTLESRFLGKPSSEFNILPKP